MKLSVQEDESLHDIEVSILCPKVDHRVRRIIEATEIENMKLAGMSEGRVAHVMPERDGLDELAVEPEQAADAPRDAAHELHVEPAARDVVVLDEREHLRLVRVAVVGGDVEDLLDVAREGGAGEGSLVVGIGLAPRDARVVEAQGVGSPGRPVGADGRLDGGVEGAVGDGRVLG